MWLRGLRTRHSVLEDVSSIPGLAQWVKYLALPHFDPWPGIFHIPYAVEKRKSEKSNLFVSSTVKSQRKGLSVEGGLDLLFMVLRGRTTWRKDFI